MLALATPLARTKSAGRSTGQNHCDGVSGTFGREVAARPGFAPPSGTRRPIKVVSSHSAPITRLRAPVRLRRRMRRRRGMGGHLWMERRLRAGGGRHGWRELRMRGAEIRRRGGYQPLQCRLGHRHRLVVGRRLIRGAWGRLGRPGLSELLRSRMERRAPHSSRAWTVSRCEGRIGYGVGRNRGDGRGWVRGGQAGSRGSEGRCGCARIIRWRNRIAAGRTQGRRARRRGNDSELWWRRISRQVPVKPPRWLGHARLAGRLACGSESEVPRVRRTPERGCCRARARLANPQAHARPRVQGPDPAAAAGLRAGTARGPENRPGTRVAATGGAPWFFAARSDGSDRAALMCCVCTAVGGTCGARATACSCRVGCAVTPPLPPL